MSPEIYAIAERSGERRLHHWFLHDETRHRHERGGRVSDYARSATSRRRRARADAARSAGDERSDSPPRAICRFRGNGSGRSSRARSTRTCSICATPPSSRNLHSPLSPALRSPARRRGDGRRPGVPTIMMFVQSLHGISHNKIEDTREEHLEMAVRAFDRLAAKTMAWLRESRESA